EKEKDKDDRWRPIVEKPNPKLILPPLPDPIEITPTPIKKETTYKLPEKASALRVGGGGRFLILHFKASKKLGIFDVSAGKIVREIPVAEEDAFYAAGMNKLLVYLPGSGVILRYDLLTGAREQAGKLDLPGSSLDAFCMGHASAGPLLVSIKRSGADLYDPA